MPSKSHERWRVLRDWGIFDCRFAIGEDATRNKVKDEVQTNWNGSERASDDL